MACDCKGCRPPNPQLDSLTYHAAGIGWALVGQNCNLGWHTAMARRAMAEAEAAGASAVRVRDAINAGVNPASVELTRRVHEAINGGQS